MNLASFYLCLFMNINTSAKLLWNAISRRIVHASLYGLIYFFCFFSCKSVFGQFTTTSSSFHSYSATSCEYDNVQVKEKSAMCHAS